MNKSQNSITAVCLNRNRFFAGFAAAFLTLSVTAYAEPHYGTVESFDGSQIVIKTLKHSTGHWKVDGHTKREGSIETADWVFADVTTSGHVTTLRLEDRPTPHAGVIEKIHDHVLTVHSGSKTETWNVNEAALLDNVTEADLQPGEEIGVKMYKNHNLATLRVVKAAVGHK